MLPAAWATAVVDSVVHGPPVMEDGSGIAVPTRLDVDPERVEEPVRADLRAVGPRVTTLWKFTCSTAAQVEVLLDHLARPYPTWVKQRLLRPLSTSVSAPYREHFLALIRVVTEHERAARTERELMLHQPLAMCAADIVVRSRKLTRRERVALIDDQSLGGTRMVFMHHMRATGYRTELERWAADPDVGGLAEDKLAGRRRP